MAGQKTPSRVISTRLNPDDSAKFDDLVRLRRAESGIEDMPEARIVKEAIRFLHRTKVVGGDSENPIKATA
ncbi:MAG: hypothetical protein AAFZ63_25185 [Bacteroidota bacterium]